MKKAVLLALAVVIFATGCMYVTREALPENLYTAPAIKAEGMEKFAHREVSRHGFRFLFIPISVPDPINIVDAMIVENRASGVTNLDVEFSELNLILFQIPRITVRADLVRKKSGSPKGS